MSAVTESNVTPVKVLNCCVLFRVEVCVNWTSNLLDHKVSLSIYTSVGDGRCGVWVWRAQRSPSCWKASLTEKQHSCSAATQPDLKGCVCGDVM